MAAHRTHIISGRISKNAHRALLKIRTDTGWSTSEIINRAIRHYIKTGNPSAELAHDKKISREDLENAG